MTGGHQRRDATRSPSTRGIPDAAAADGQAPAVVRAVQGAKTKPDVGVA